MEPLNFLGGKYQQGTQILPGTLQTFRAVDSATGRDVFVHRAPSNDPAAHQLALLLSSALVKSAKARRMVLDVIEENGFAYVVTETEHQCLLLREWLQFEINQAAVPESAPRPTDTPPAPGAAPPQPVKQSAPELKHNSAPSVPEPAPQAPSEPKQELGEFTRMFTAGPPSPSLASSASPLEDTQPSLPSLDVPSAPEPPKPELTKDDPGEFTRMFLAGAAAAKQEVRPAAARQEVHPAAAAKQELHPPAAAKQEVRPSAAPKEEPRPAVSRDETPPAPSKPASEPGEFTRFFRAPNPPERKPSADVGRSPERPSNPDIGRTGFVQRPSTPISVPPAPAQKGTDPGEFTRMFSQAGGFAPAPPAPSLPQNPASSMPDPFAAPTGGGLFGEPAPSSSVPPPVAKQVGEYTRIFGLDAQGPPVQQQSSVAPPPALLSDDPLSRAAGPSPSAAPPPASTRGPSEYTLVMSGQPSPPAPATPPPSGPPAGGAGAANVPLPKVDMKFAPPPNPLQGLHVPPPPSAQAGGAGASASSPLGSASAHVAGPRIPAATPPPMNFKAPALKPPAPPAIPTPQSKNKLVLLFVVLGVLAILLIILIALILKK